MNRKNVFAALHALQCDLQSMPKNRKADRYKYTDLDTIWDGLRPLLRKHSVAIWQGVEDVQGRVAVRTIVAHTESGEELETITVAPSETGKASRLNPMQELGVEITYLRRYSLCAAIGITSDEDNDGSWISDAAQELEAAKHAAVAKDIAEQCAGYLGKEQFTELRQTLEMRYGKPLPQYISKPLTEAYNEFTKGAKNA